MTQEEKINYMRIACGISGFALQTYHFDLVVSTYELLVAKGGNAKLDEIVQVEHECKMRKDAREKEEARKQLLAETKKKRNEKK